MIASPRADSLVPQRAGANPVQKESSTTAPYPARQISNARLANHSAATSSWSCLRMAAGASIPACGLGSLTLWPACPFRLLPMKPPLLTLRYVSE